MNLHKFRWFALILGAILTLGVPVSAIWSHFRILETGDTVKFQLVPVDPYDPFRGRYVSLRIQNEPVPAATAEDAAGLPADHAYLSYTVDQNGFAQAQALHISRPENKPSIRVFKIRIGRENSFRYSLPFDRYYLNEKDAPLAEQIARERMPRNPSDDTQAEPSYLVLRVLNGDAAIDSLYIGNKTVEEHIREARAQPTSE